MSRISTLKRKSFLDFCNQLCNLFFPKICAACGEKCQTKVLCPECWSLCELPDPIQRCRHCFELSEDQDLCMQCRKKPILQIQRAYVFDPESPAKNLGVHSENALASFVILQWIKLDFPIFDLIVPMPDQDSIRIALALSKLLQKPIVRAINFLGELKRDRIEEQQLILLFDVSNSVQNLKKASNALLETSPKRVYLLSLYPNVDSHF